MGAVRENVDRMGHEGGEIRSSHPLLLTCKDYLVASPILCVHVLACLHKN